MAFNLSGKRFGVLEVIENAGWQSIQNGRSDTVWRCKCSRCGETSIVKSKSLSGNRKTCNSWKCSEMTRIEIEAGLKAKQHEKIIREKAANAERSKRKWAKWFASKKYRKIMFARIKEKFGCMNPNCHWTGPLPARLVDFHHKDPEIKEFLVARIKSGDIKKLAAEIRKCVCLCSNCHRLAHS